MLWWVCKMIRKVSTNATILTAYCLFIFSNLVIWVVLHFEWFSNAVANLPVTLVHAAVIELMSEQDIKGFVFCHHFLTLMSFQTSSENCIACEMHLHVDSAFLLESHISSPPKSEFSKYPLVLLILKTASSTFHPFWEMLSCAVSSEQFPSCVCAHQGIIHVIKQECKTVHATQLGYLQHVLPLTESSDNRNNLKMIIYKLKVRLNLLSMQWKYSIWSPEAVKLHLVSQKRLKIEAFHRKGLKSQSKMYVWAVLTVFKQLALAYL